MATANQHMQSLTFNELTRRAKDLAIARYSEDQAITDLVAKLMDKGIECETPEHIFLLANWRYTEHGERIA